MKRLTIRNPDGSVSQPTDLNLAEALEKLAAYEDADEEGRLVGLPCKVQDKVYRLWPCGKHGKSVSEMVVKHIDLDFLPEIEFSCRKETGTGCYWFFKIPDIGNTVFLTREEAEIALDEIK